MTLLCHWWERYSALKYIRFVGNFWKTTVRRGKSTLLCWLWKTKIKRLGARQKSLQHWLMARAWAAACLCRHHSSSLNSLGIQGPPRPDSWLPPQESSHHAKSRALFIYKNPQSRHCLCHIQSFTFYSFYLRYPSPSLSTITFSFPPH